MSSLSPVQFHNYCPYNWNEHPVRAFCHKIKKLVTKVARISHVLYLHSLERVIQGYSFLMSERVGQWSSLPVSLKKSINYIHFVAGEVFGAFFLTALLPTNLELFDPKIGSKNSLILFIPGFLCTGSHWIYHKKNLEKKGYKNLYTLNLGDPRKSIKEYAKRVREKIEEIQKSTDCKEIILIGLSMGGLIAMDYLYSYAQEQGITVKKVITIGTPFSGSKIMRFISSLSHAAKEMDFQSSYIKDLQKRSSHDTATPYVHIATEHDEIIQPPSSAFDNTAQNIVRTETLKATGHIAYFFSKRVSTIFCEEIEKM